MTALGLPHDGPEALVPAGVALVLGSIGQVAAVVLAVVAGWNAARGFGLSRERAEFLIAAALLSLATAVLVVTGLGLAGLLRPIPVLLASALAALAACASARRRRAPPGLLPRLPPALASTAAAVIGLTVPFWYRALTAVPVTFDAITYHLFNVARWLREGRLFLEAQWPFPLNWLDFYPAGGNLVTAFMMAVVRNDVFAEIVNIPLIAMLGVAVAALCRRLGGTREAAAAAGLLLVTTPLLFNFAASAYVEPLLDFALVAAVVFALMGIDCDPGRSPAIAALAGVAVGLAVGTKLMALPTAAFLAVLVGSTPLLRRLDARLVLRVLVAFAIPVLLLGGYSYFRNAWVTGNPFYPVSVGPFRGIEGTSGVFGYACDRTEQWRSLPSLIRSGLLPHAWLGTPGYIHSYLAYGWKLFLLAPVVLAGAGWLVAAGVGAARRRQWTRSAPPLVVLAAAALLLVTYLQLPICDFPYNVRTHVRFSAPALLLLTAAGMAFLSRRIRSRGWLAAFPAVGIVVDLAFLDLRMPGLNMAGVVVAIFAAFGLSAAWLWGWLRPGRAIAAGLAGILVLCGTAPLVRWREAHRYQQLGSAVEVHVPHHWYYAGAARYLQEEWPGQPLAVSSSEFFGLLYMFVGPDFSRPVCYVLANDGAPESYRHPDGHLRKVQDREAWLRNLLRSGVGLLLTVKWHTGESWPPETAWSEELGFPVLYADDHAKVFRVARTIGGPWLAGSGAPARRERESASPRGEAAASSSPGS